jgi:hypothetical protein
MLPPDGFPANTKDQRSRLQHTISYRLPAISCQLCPLRGGAPALDEARGDGVARPPGVAVGGKVAVRVGVAVGVAVAVALGVGVGGLTTS